MARYANTPGGAEAAPAAWPTNSQIPLDGSRPTLVMFVHPHCPCSRASVGELNRLLARIPGQLSVHVVFLKPEGTSLDWQRTGLWREASSIPGVVVHTDLAGVEARRFHAETSGQTLLYHPRGSLEFEGGITFARGHSGDNAGSSAVEEIVRLGHSGRAKTQVFGCALFEAQSVKGETLCKP
jgi:hypothetical protein